VSDALALWYPFSQRTRERFISKNAIQANVELCAILRLLRFDKNVIDHLAARLWHRLFKLHPSRAGARRSYSIFNKVVVVLLREKNVVL